MEWEQLSIREKAKYIRMGIKSGLSLKEIKDAYNSSFKKDTTRDSSYSAGHLAEALYQDSREEYLGEPSHHYDFTQSEEWANAHGYYPDERGHRDDRVKKEAHPTHPSRGSWNGQYQFELSDRGMEDPNYTLFGMADGNQDPQATLTYNGGVVLPELTVTPEGNYYHNSYDNVNIHKYPEDVFNRDVFNEEVQEEPSPNFMTAYNAQLEDLSEGQLLGQLVRKDVEKYMRMPQHDDL